MTLERLAARGREIGEVRAAVIRDRVAALVQAEVPDARIEISGFEVTVWGWGLRLALRWIGSLLR